MKTTINKVIEDMIELYDGGIKRPVWLRYETGNKVWSYQYDNEADPVLEMEEEHKKFRSIPDAVAFLMGLDLANADKEYEVETRFSHHFGVERLQVTLRIA